MAANRTRKLARKRPAVAANSILPEAKEAKLSSQPQAVHVSTKRRKLARKRPRTAAVAQRSAA